MGDFGQNPMANQGSGWSAPKPMGGGGGPPVKYSSKYLNFYPSFSLVDLGVHQWVEVDLGVRRGAEDLEVLHEAVASEVPQVALEVLPVDSEGAALEEVILPVVVVSAAVSEAEDAEGENQLRPMLVCYQSITRGLISYHTNSVKKRKGYKGAAQKQKEPAKPSKQLFVRPIDNGTK